MHATSWDAMDTVVAVFPDHGAAEAAVKMLTAEGIALKTLSVVGKGYHTGEKTFGLYNVGDRVRFWGSSGAFWGGLWSLFFGGMLLTLPITGPVILVGYVAAAAVSAFEGALMAVGLSAAGAALASIGIPRESVLHYETAIAADGFLVMAHGTAGDMAHAEHVLKRLNPSFLKLHIGRETAVALGAPGKHLAGVVV